MLVILGCQISTITYSQVSLSSTGGATGPVTYSTLKMAFDSINIGKHTGAITINVIGNTTELASAVLNASGSGSSSYTSILIKPTGGGLKTIAGSLAGPLIDFNGADNVTIDGLDPSNDSLLLVNQSTGTNAANSTIRLINGACNNKIQNCGVFGGSPSTTSGTIFISTDAVGNGNDSNIISRVWISSASSGATHRYGVYALGSPGKENQFNIIKDCWIADYHGSTASNRSGVYIGDNCNNFQIYGNSFFQSSSRSVSSATYSAIYINALNSGDFLIRKNKIGGSLPDCLGTPTSLTTSPLLQAIYINTNTSNKVIIDSNEIANISISTTNTSILQSLIQINGGKLEIKNNLFGSNSTTGSISFTNTPTNTTFSIIGMGTGNCDTISITNNHFASMSITGSGGTSLRGIDIVGVNPNMIINNNIFGSTTLPNCWYQATTNSILAIIMRTTNASFLHQIRNNIFANLAATTAQIRAIMATGTSNAFRLEDNTIYNLSTGRNTAGTGTNAAIIGILFSATGPNQTCQGNKIYALRNTGTGTMTVTGIYFANTGTNTYNINNNLIHSLNVDGTGGTIHGINLEGGSSNLFNNMIRFGYDESGSAITTSINMMGINDFSGAHQLFYNSIFIGGSNVNTGNANTYCVYSNDSLSNRAIKNNIFSNVRANGTSTGKHYSARYASVYYQSINNNDYYNGSNFMAQVDGVDYSTFASWRGATGKDSLSVNINPVFKNPTGNTSTLDLHIDTSGTTVNFLESSGTVVSIVSTDYDGQNRPGPSGSLKGGASNPDIGADEFDGVPPPSCASVNAGTTLSTVDSLCKTGVVTLSLSGTSGQGLGFSYQWQSSANGVSFSNITSANAEQYTTGTISTSTYYRCRVYCINDSSLSFSTIKKITVLTPQVLSNTPGYNCGPGSVTLAASGNGTMRWYASNVGGSPIDTGTTFITPTISTNTIYYVEASYNGTCNSTNRTGVLASIRAIPSITATTSATICGSGFATITATPSAGSINWYDSTIAGNLLGTSNAFVTPTISTTKTYYAEAINSGCTTLSRTPVTVTVTPVPTVTSVSSNSRCGNGTVTLQATVSSGKALWYSASTGGTLLDSSLTFVTPVLTASTTYFVAAKDGPCISSTRTAVTATINQIPSIISTTAGSNCGSGGVTLQASASSGSVRWYDAATNGNLLYTGSPFITPIISSTTTYYAEAYSNGCSSNPRTAVIATINAFPSIASVSNKVNCGPGILILGASASNGTILWYSDSVGGTILSTGNLFTTPTLSATTKYWIVAVENGCTSNVRTPVLAEIKPIPTITGTTPSSACEPSSLTLLASTSSGTIKWYNAATGGTLLSTGNTFQTPILNATNTYYVEATDSPCTSTSRVSVLASIYPSLDKSTTVLGSTITANATGVNYQWVNCSNNFALITGATNQSFSPSTNGIYAVIISNSNCVDTSNCVSINSVGIGSKANSTINVYPNPTNELIILNTGAELLGKKYQITDAIGRTFCQGTIVDESQIIFMKEFPQGVYLLVISGNTPIRIVKY